MHRQSEQTSEREWEGARERDSKRDSKQKGQMERNIATAI